MPMYEFYCEQCGLLFEELVSDDDDHVTCESCDVELDSEDDRQVSDFGFGFDAGRYEDGTTGVDSVDNDPDQIIGQDADRRWEEIKDRQSTKRKIGRQARDDEQAPLKRLPSEEPHYEAMDDDEVTKNAYMHRERKKYEEVKQKGQDQSNDLDEKEE